MRLKLSVQALVGIAQGGGKYRTFKRTQRLNATVVI